MKVHIINHRCGDDDMGSYTVNGLLLKGEKILV